MRHQILTAGEVAIGIFIVCGAFGAQSLGELARKERAKREGEKRPAAKVWTNDNIPKASRIEPYPPNRGTAAPAPEPAPPPAEAAPSSEPSTGSEPTKEDKQHDKSYWQARFKPVRAQLADAEERQRLAEDELSLLQTQQARELNPEANKALGEKVTAKSAEVDQARGVTAKARQALDDLQKEFDASGAPAEWSTTD